MLTNVKYWLWLTNLLEPAQAWQVYCHFGSVEKAYFSDPEEYEQMEDLSPAQRKLLGDKSVSAAEQILARCDSQGIRILTFSDTDYPERLRNIEVPPLVLYLRGRLIRFDERAVIAFAGTRKATPYGVGLASSFAGEITRSGGIVATGIVSGCDESAATGALRAGGPLVLVVAGGVDVPYYDSPRSVRLLEDAAAVGAIVSECPPGMKHKGALFRRRNAILCGLCVGLLCVEAGERSGTLGVAELASEQGRDVFAIPANVGAPMSAGTNELLRQGLAIPVLSAQDILSRYSYLLSASQPDAPDFTRWRVVHIPGRKTPEQEAKPESPSAADEGAPGVDSTLSAEKGVDTFTNSRYIELLDNSDRWRPEEAALLKALIPGPATVEALIDATGLSAGLVAATLTMLAVDGVVEECSGGRFRLLPEGII